MADALEVRRREATRLMELGHIEGWQALELIVWPAKGSRLENPPLEQHRWSEDVKDECRRLYREGLTLPQVARGTGVTSATAKFWIQPGDYRRRTAA